MGVLKFQVTSPDLASRLPDLRKAYMTGLDRTPSRLAVEVRQNLMICHRDSAESGRLYLPWPVPGRGTPVVGTATLAERPEPYNLAVELARGKLNDVRNQLADWTQMGLQAPDELRGLLARAQAAFVKSALSANDPRSSSSYEASQTALALTSEAGDILTEAYTTQVLQTRLSTTARLATQLVGTLEGDPKAAPWSSPWGRSFNAARVSVPWRSLAPSEGVYRWDELDAQFQWCKKHQVPFQAGPLIDLRPGVLPDWIWLWEGDYEPILGLVVDLVRAAVHRYRGKVPVWHLIHRLASTEILGLSEEEQIRITARALQVARQADPSAQFTIGLDRPWAEWMGSSHFQLGPLHLADYLVRADIGLAGLAIEVAPGYSPPGSQNRDLFEFSKLLDFYALLNLPLHVWLTSPSSAAPDPAAAGTTVVDPSQWAAPPTEQSQAEWAARWVALAVAKPYVRSVSWLQTSDATPHLYPHGGLFRHDQTPKPLAGWLERFRGQILA